MNDETRITDKRITLPCPRVYSDIIQSNHILIAGCSGCGKSTLINNLLYALMLETPAPYLFIIDPKRIDFRYFDGCKLLVKRVTDIDSAVNLLKQITDIIDARFREIELHYDADKNITNRAPIYVIIDEYFDLLNRDKKRGKLVESYIKQIIAIGRAVRVHLILSTQVVLASVITTEIRGNCDCQIALHTATVNQSRVIIGTAGAESLPKYGKMLVNRDGYIKENNAPLIPADYMNTAVNYWHR